MVADEAVHAEDEDPFHRDSLVQRDLAIADAIGEFLRGEPPAVQFQIEELQNLAVGARGVTAAAFRVEERGRPRRALVRGLRVRSTRSRVPSTSVKAPG